MGEVPKGGVIGADEGWKGEPEPYCGVLAAVVFGLGAYDLRLRSRPCAICCPMIDFPSVISLA